MLTFCKTCCCTCGSNCFVNHFCMSKCCNCICYVRVATNTCMCCVSFLCTCGCCYSGTITMCAYSINAIFLHSMISICYLVCICSVVVCICGVVIYKFSAIYIDLYITYSIFSYIECVIFAINVFLLCFITATINCYCCSVISCKDY